MLGRFTILSLVFVVSGVSGVAACSKEPAPAAKAEAPKPAAAAVDPANVPTPPGPSGIGGAAAAGDPAATGKQRAEGQGYLVEVKAPADVASGQEGVAKVVLNATGGYHLNKEYPTKLDVVAPEGVTLAKTTFVIDDAASFEEKQATWDVKFTSGAAGEKKFGATFKFAVCTETTCDPKKEALAWTVPVK